ncbi:MAG TPA: o-succinylbenzoate synthase [Myxococcaceae bacterium]|nr:o-succinylbenzoate synthase [Myxococcaceae bacterium]
MRILEFQIRPLALELKTPLLTARAEYRVREGAVIELTDGRARGWGEAMPLVPFGTEDVGESLRILAGVAAAIVGENLPEEPRGIDALLDTEPALTSAPAARHAVESALLDVIARRRGMPLRALLTKQPRDEVAVGTVVAAAEPEAVAVEAKAAVASGFQTLKLKLARSAIDVDVRRLAAARAAVGPEIRIRGDVNGGWSESEAGDNLRRVGAVGLELCEQPVPVGAVARMRSLRGAVPCRIAADESVRSAADAATLLEPTPAVDLLVLKPMVLGGLWRSLEIARRAAARGVGTYVSSSLDGVVARGAAAQLAAALPGGEWASGLGVGGLFRDEPERHPVTPRRGRIALDPTPGLGFDGGVP